MKLMEYLYSGLLLASLVLFYFAYSQFAQTQRLINDGVKTRAEVVDLIPIRGDNGYSYKPVYEFTDRLGAKVSFVSDVASKPAPYQVGDYVNILYAKDGEVRKVVSFWGLYRYTILLLCFAFSLLIIGGGYFLYARGL